ncbi:MAG: toll/interleukin-1 receptor domain-containing protein [Defluviitaleaceae bacterium]|nr:toll/interleukin-1 receptor domain-containing protein [Defluviitaleaceae bacterium]
MNNNYYDLAEDDTQTINICKTCHNLQLYFYDEGGDYGFSVGKYLEVQAPVMEAMSSGLSNFHLYMWLIDQGGCFDCIYEIMKGIPNLEMLESANVSCRNNPYSAQRLEELRLFIAEKERVASQRKREYDIFISFKNSDSDGNQTLDSKIAEKCYNYLSAKGLNVFFSNIELEAIGTADYTKAIDDALDSSQFLIAVGCSRDNLDSRWVRYEWNGFLNDIRSNVKSNAQVFVLYQGMSVNELPRALRQQQAFDASDDSAYDTLYKFILNGSNYNP